MKEQVLCALMAVAAALAPAPAAAAGDAGDGGAAAVVLQVRPGSGPVARGATFPDAASALDAIADASAQRPYVVRIAPGVHAVPSRGLVLKPFVTLEGDGTGTTVLAGAVAAESPLWTSQLPPDQPAVVRMASDSRLRRLTVRNTSVEGGIAVNFPATRDAGAEDVVAEVLGRMNPGFQHDYHAVHVAGPGASVTLDRVTATVRMETPADAVLVGDNAAIVIFGPGKLLVRNSRAVTESGWWNVGIAVAAQAECTVLDSAIVVSGRAEGAFAFSNQGGAADLRDTTLSVTCPPSSGWGCAAIYGCEGRVTVAGSDLQVFPGAKAADASLLRCEGTISGSRLAGPAVYDDWTLVDCRDGDSRPIPDRP